jgi:hypothetical protein
VPVRGSVTPGAPGGVVAPGLNPRVPVLGAGALGDPPGDPPVVCASAEPRVATTTAMIAISDFMFVHSGIGHGA